MKKLLLYISFTLLIINCFAQNNELDSLKELEKKLPENKQKVEILYQIGILYEHNNPTIAFEYYQKGYDIAQNLKNDTLIGLGLYNLGIYYLENRHLEKSLEMHRKAINIFKKTNFS